ncbi:MAG: type IV pili twitching motility protein PilT, partial [Gemmatimonadaceae bacterium]|nr:type IV pili twitching motility protein PilT [Gemmatimonadaceae bacterium]
MSEPTSTGASQSIGDKPISGQGQQLSAQLRSWLASLIERDGSDLHLKVGRAPTIRVSGDLVSLDHPALKAEDLSALAEQIMPQRYLKEFQQTREADFAIGVSGIGRFRVNAYQQRGTVAF